MKLRKIKLKNFRQYYGEQEIEFSIDNNRNVTVIYGKNGAGKTSLFTAINWVLYGNDIKIDGKIVNKKAIEEAKDKGEKYVEAEVTLIFSNESEDNQSKNYQITRKINYDIENEREMPSNLEAKQIHPEIKNIDDWNIKLNTILPPTVRTYFFFDGEKIDEFSKPEHEEEVKEAVNQVLGLEVLKRAIKHLDSIIKDYNSEIKQRTNSLKLKELKEEEEKLINQKEETEEKIKNLQEEEKNIRIRIRELNEELKKFENIREYIKEKEIIERTIENIENKLEGLYSEKLNKLIDECYILIGKDIIEFSKKFIEEREIKNDRIPSNYLIALIDQIINNGVCICGTNINHEIKNNLTYKKLNIRKEEEKNPIQTILREIHTLTTELKLKSEERYKELENLYMETIELKTELEKQKTKLANINEIIEEKSLDDERRINQEINKLSEELGKINEKINRLENDKNEIEEKRKNLKKEIEEEEKKDKIISEIREKRDLAEKIHSEIKKAHEYLQKNSKIEIENETTNIFKRLIRKKEVFKKIELSDDYTLKVIDTFEDIEAKNSLSAGERQILSLSFILALAKVSNKEAPFVMDTPFGRLDKEHRENILQTMPSITKQLVFLATPTEITTDLESLIDEKIGKKYELEFDENEKYTKIRPL